MSVVTVSVDKGELKFFSAQKWFDVSRVEWLTDESILVAARELRGGPSRIWQVSYPGGEAQPLTTDLDSYINISLSADRKLLAAVARNNVANLWVMSGFDATKANQITQGQSFNTQPAWTPGGQIVFPSRAGDNIDLYSVDARGGSPKQLTVNAATNTAPCVSFDGRYVVFVSNRSGTTRIWRMDADGSNAKPLTEGIAFAPSCAPADSWFAFQGGTPPLIWRMSMDGGQPTKIDQTDFQYAPLISPDGKRIACFYNSSQDLTRNLVSIIPAEGGPRLKTLELGSLESRVRWSPDGQALVYALTRSGVSNLWAQPVAGGPPKQLTNFTSERIFAFDFSHDGKQVALSRGTRLSDVVLISNFQQ